jgi:hypothetical protein
MESAMVLWRSLDPRVLLAVLASARREPPQKAASVPATTVVPVAAGKPVA